MTELKPCPFCGSIDIYAYEPTVYEVGNDASVECQECGAEIRASTLKMAIAKWNRRERNERRSQIETEDKDML